MSESEIPPRWFRTALSAPGRTTFELPMLLRGRLKSAERPMVLYVAGATGPLALAMRAADGRELARTEIRASELSGLLLPQGTAALTLEGPGAGQARLGYFPRSKVGLKLHAFVKGRLSTRSPRARLKEAGAAARDLRARLASVLRASPAGPAITAAAYRPFRARFVGDFRDGVGPAAAPALAFVSQAARVPLEALAACAAALGAQSDPQFRWIVAVPESRLAAERPALEKALAGKATLLPVVDEAPAAGLAAALGAAGDGLVCPLDARGRPTPDAVAMIRAAFAAHPDLALLYTDEEELDGRGQPFQPVFKPAFNRHLIEAMPYMGSLVALRADRASRLGLRAELRGAALYDLVLRALAELPAGAVRHLPRVAYSGPAQAPGFADAETARLAAVALGERLGVEVDMPADGRHLRPLYKVPSPAPLVSIVIPTRDRADLMGMTLRSLIARTDYRAFEIIIVDNGSVEPETFALFEEIKARWPATTVVRDDGDFNYPRICNAGVAVAKGEMILLLNNDIEVVEGGWLDEMVALASLPGAGIVGAKLLFPDRTVQHGGVIVGTFRYADHWFSFSAADAPGYRDRLLVRQNLSAVTGACLLIRRDCWETIGPLDAERFAEDCNDIDLCLRARRAGFEVVFTPFACLIHHESASRGRRRSKAHRERLKAQRARMEDIWHPSVLVDPHYSPNLRRASHHADLADAPEGDRAPRTDAI